MKCVRYTSKSPKGWLKKRTFPFLNKTKFQLNEVCYEVSLRENFQRQSCSTLIPLPNGTQMLGERLTIQPQM